MVTFLGMATIIFMMTNDHPKDVVILGTVWRILTILGRVTLLGMVTILEMVAILGIFTILRDGYLLLGLVSTKNQIEQSVSFYLCLFVCEFVGH